MNLASPRMKRLTKSSTTSALVYCRLDDDRPTSTELGSSAAPPAQQTLLPRPPTGPNGSGRVTIKLTAPAAVSMTSVSSSTPKELNNTEPNMRLYR
jgi:hypothetical protein